MDGTSETGTLRRRLTLFFWAFIAAYLLHFAAIAQALALRQDSPFDRVSAKVTSTGVIIGAAALGVFLIVFVMYAWCCIRALEHLGRSTRLAVWFFLLWPVVVLGLLGLALAGFPLPGGRIVEATPIAFYLNLRGALASKQTESLLRL
jgi:hypothetical protein